MKKNLIFISLLLVIFVLMYMTNTNKPPLFRWKASFHTDDKQPYGSYAFDEMIGASWPQEYILSYENIFHLYNDESLKDKNLLIVSEEFNIDSEELVALFKYIESGGKAFIASNFFSYALTDTLSLELKNNFQYSINLSLLQENTYIKFTNNTDSVSGIPQSIITDYFYNDTIAALYEGITETTVAYNKSNNDLIKEYNIGKGSLYMCCTPLLFTNYAILSDSIHPFIEYSLSPLTDKPLIRTEFYHYGEYSRETGSVFRYLLSQPSLKWAFYIMIGCVILFMIFTAKRKQKIIPIIKPPANKMLEFVHSISALYLRKNNNAHIIMKKYIYWGDELRRKYGIDIINEKHDKSFLKRFSSKTGMPESDARYFFLELDIIDENSELTDKEMMDLITKMTID